MQAKLEVRWNVDLAGTTKLDFKDHMHKKINKAC